MLKKFIIRTLIFSAIIAAISYALFFTVIPNFYLPVFPFLIVFFAGLTIGVHLILTNAGKKKISQFSTYYMGSITAKLFIYLIFIIIYVFSDRENAVPFLITFLLLYFLFTSFETYYLLKDLKKQQ